MDINFNRAADAVLMEVLGTYIDASGMVWSDGVSQQQYDNWCIANKSPGQGDIRGVSWTPTKKQIVSDLYWIPNSRLAPSGLDYLLLDTSINLSIADAVIVLQRTLGVPATGIIDDPTKAKLNTLRVPLGSEFVNVFCDEHEIHFTEVIAAHPANEDKLRHFWNNRIMHERANAITILRGG